MQLKLRKRRGQTTRKWNGQTLQDSKQLKLPGEMRSSKFKSTTYASQHISASKKLFTYKYGTVAQLDKATMQYRAQKPKLVPKAAAKDLGEAFLLWMHPRRRFYPICLPREKRRAMQQQRQQQSTRPPGYLLSVHLPPAPPAPVFFSAPA